MHLTTVQVCRVWRLRAQGSPAVKRARSSEDVTARTFRAILVPPLSIATTHDALTRDIVRARVSKPRLTSTRSHIGPGGLSSTLQC
jgi:hypothetical protein